TCVHLKSTKAGLSRKINELLQAPSELQSKNDALEKRCATLRGQNANLNKKIRKLLSTTPDAPANNSSKKRKNPPPDPEVGSESIGRSVKRRKRATASQKKNKNRCKSD
ncbi:hypothetical protein B0H16DRAFT_1477802, partial [Mycena metata]